MNKDAGLLINVSRGIIYAGKGENFADAVHAEGRKYQQEMAAFF